MGFVTLEEYKSYAEISSNNDDRKLINLIDTTAAYIKSYCGVDFTSATYTEELDLEGRYIFLGQMPATSVASVQYYDADGILQTIASTEYRLCGAEAYLLLTYEAQALIALSKFPEKQVVVEYTAGYASAPLDVKQANMDLVKYYHKSEYLPVMSANVRTIDYDVMHSVSLPPHIRRMLSIYRKIE